MNSSPPSKSDTETGLLLAWDAKRAISAEKRRIADAIVNFTGCQVSLISLAKATARLYRAKYPDAVTQGCSDTTIKSVIDARLPAGMTRQKGAKVLTGPNGEQFGLHSVTPSQLRDAAVSLGIDLDAVKAPRRLARVTKPRAAVEAAPEVPAAMPPIADPIACTVATLAGLLRAEGLTSLLLNVTPTGFAYSSRGPGGTGGGAQ